MRKSLDGRHQTEVSMPSLAALLAPLLLFTSGPDTCVSQEQALRAVAHDFWLGYNRRDTTLLAKVLDDQLLLVPATGIVTTKPELPRSYRRAASTDAVAVRGNAQ
jgi:hypothetical protein